MINHLPGRYLGYQSLAAPRVYRSQLGIAGNVVAAIITGAINVTMTSIQLIAQVISENRARVQWRHEQARQRAAALDRQAAVEQENATLRTQLEQLTSIPGVSTVSSIQQSLSSLPAWWPYAALGGGALLVILLSRRK